jgi:hypothetical protein
VVLVVAVVVEVAHLVLVVLELLVKEIMVQAVTTHLKIKAILLAVVVGLVVQVLIILAEGELEPYR